jgi:hypothetical protein
MTACQREVKSCIEGTLLPCVCGGGQHGQALCLPGGTAATSCQCEPPPDLAALDLAGPDLATPADLGEPHDQSSEHLRWVFVTSAVLQGNFQSDIGADTYCKQLGSSRLRSGRKWVAWTSTAALGDLNPQMAGKRIWRQVRRDSTDGIPTIEEAQLFRFPGEIRAAKPFEFDENGNVVSFPQRIWWPSDPSNPSGNCNEWRVAQVDGGGYTGAYASLSNESLWRHGSQPCDQQAHILCLEE